MMYELKKKLVVGGRARHRAAARLAAGVFTVVAAAAVSLVGVSPAFANTHPRTHVMKINNGVSALRRSNLINHGGPVQTAPVVYIDFWGWGSDPTGEQSYLTNFLGSVGGSSWLSSVNQYGASNNSRLGGTWSDSAGVPAAPSDGQIQAEAANAAAHFGTGGSVNVEIVVATPTGHSTPGFGTQWCAYHGAVASNPNITYTDLPYMSDAGASCGSGSVTGSALDGVSIVEGHELAETITDPLLNAWYDAGGQENGDLCAWTGLHTISTSGGTFAVQPLWSNAVNGCAG
ncbi:MAG: hypothetical protein ACRDP6_37735 [Actinoallomurus sp.]